MSAITHLTSLPELNKLLAAKKDRLVVIDFHATWCGPCHAIAPTFEKLANQYRQATFCKVDVDAAQEIARAYSVRAMPTFVFIKNERKVHEVKGANASAIESGIKQFVGGSGGEAGAFPGQGHTLAGTPVPTEAPPAEVNYVRWLIFGALALWWFWSARQSKEQ